MIIKNKHSFQLIIPKNRSYFKILIISITIFMEFIRGFINLKKYKKAVTFFGSARNTLSRKYYDDAKCLAELLAKDGFAVITGGADGIMGAANKGAHSVDGHSIGYNIILPHEQKENKYLTDSMDFKYFFSRKVMLSSGSLAYIYFPGGYGTFDELFQMLTLIQTKKIPKVPVILIGKDYWNPIDKIIKELLRDKYKTIGKDDDKLYRIMDDCDEAYECIKKIDFIMSDKGNYLLSSDQGIYEDKKDD